MVHCKVCGKPILATKYWDNGYGKSYHKECAKKRGYKLVEGWLINNKGDCLWKRDYDKEELQEVVERLLDGNETEQ